MLTKTEILRALKSYAADGTLKTAGREALQRRIQTLADIEYAAQEAREQLEATLLDRDEQGI